MIPGAYQPARPGENPRMKKGDEGRRHISGNAARAAADDGAAADSERAGQREKTRRDRGPCHAGPAKTGADRAA